MIRLLLPALGSAALLMAAPLAAQNYAVQPRIYGGDDARQGDWPWMAYVAIEYTARPSQLCGGVLIAPDLLVTAAHCVFNESTQSNFIYVLVDEVDKNADTFSSAAFAPNIIPHEAYDPLAENYQNDIAILKLNDQLDVARFPSLGSLSDVAYLENLSPSGRNDIMTALGWGRTESSTVSFPDILQQVQIDYIPRATCSSQWSSNPDVTITTGMLCAAEPNPPTSAGQDTCNGDSGGPLLIGSPTRPQVLGLTSFGSTCGPANPPAVYTNIAHHIGWIEEKAASFGSPVADIEAMLPASVRSGIGSTVTLTMTIRNASIATASEDVTFTVNVPAGTVIDNPLLDGSPASCTGVDTLTCDVADTLLAGASHSVTMDITHTGDSDIDRTLTFNVTHNRFDYRSLNNTDVEVPLTFSDAPVGGGGSSSGGALFYTLPWLALGALLRRRKWSVSQPTSSSASSSGAR